MTMGKRLEPCKWGARADSADVGCREMDTVVMGRKSGMEIERLRMGVDLVLDSGRLSFGATVGNGVAGLC